MTNTTDNKFQRQYDISLTVLLVPYVCDQYRIKLPTIQVYAYIHCNKSLTTTAWISQYFLNWKHQYFCYVNTNTEESLWNSALNVPLHEKSKLYENWKYFNNEPYVTVNDCGYPKCIFIWLLPFSGTFFYVCFKIIMQI